MNFWETVLSGIIVFVLGSLTTWTVTSTVRWHASRKAAKHASSERLWTFEQIKDDEWNLRRDSPFDAFSLRVWNKGDAEKAGDVKFAEILDRGDLRSGDSVRVSGIRPGVEVLMDWVENSERLAVSIDVREGANVMAVSRCDAEAYVGW